MKNLDVEHGERSSWEKTIQESEGSAIPPLLTLCLATLPRLNVLVAHVGESDVKY